MLASEYTWNGSLGSGIAKVGADAISSLILAKEAAHWGDQTNGVSLPVSFVRGASIFEMFGTKRRQYCTIPMKDRRAERVVG